MASYGVHLLRVKSRTAKKVKFESSLLPCRHFLEKKTVGLKAICAGYASMTAFYWQPAPVMGAIHNMGDLHIHRSHIDFYARLLIISAKVS